MRLLIIDDEPGIVVSLYNALGGTYIVESAMSGQAGLRKILANPSIYDTILLDLHLRDMSGLDVCERIRSHGITTPILVLSGEDAVDSKVTLLDSGANDYLTKPFKREELEARIRVLTREHHSRKRTPARISVDDLVLDTVTRQVTRAGNPIVLRHKEFTLLECLMQNAGKVVSREILAIHTWDENFSVVDNTVRVHMAQLRQKVDQPFKRPLIKTVHGFGYKIDTYKKVAPRKKKGAPRAKSTRTTA